MCYCTNRVPREKRQVRCNFSTIFSFSFTFHFIQFEHHEILRACVLSIKNQVVTAGKNVKPPRARLNPFAYYSINGFIGVSCVDPVTGATREIDEDG